MANEQNTDSKAKAESTVAAEARPTITTAVSTTKASDADTERVRKAWYEGGQIPEGFECRFETQGGETRLMVYKRG